MIRSNCLAGSNSTNLTSFRVMVFGNLSSITTGWRLGFPYFKGFTAPFSAILRYKWDLLFGISCIWLFQYLDRRLIKNRIIAT